MENGEKLFMFMKCLTYLSRAEKRSRLGFRGLVQAALLKLS
jgi:hypothetical protein